MGVPKFYRWISERYPQINQVITDSALLPEFDHLYLDMNGIIHGCTHPAHLDVSERLSERDMVMGIMHYIDRIVTQIVKPKVSVYMAIDGVAPRAKLNQQRSRRFRSAKDLAEATKGKDLFHDPTGVDDSSSPSEPHGGAFDSNCITPGTEFMTRVSDAIKYFIRKKIKEDPLWRNLKVIFSGHEIPGEGEHKIMQHIRDMKSHPDYQPNTRHCMYGQDADLIMLGLVSHEPHFTLLREIVDFGMNNKNKNSLKTVKKFTKESDFQLLHLSILREYLNIEFAYGLDKGTYDLERIIDDFVFMTFLVGNDFLPHLPALDIGDGAFDLVFSTYKAQRPTWGENQYLTYSGTITDAARLEGFLKAIGEAENDILEQREENEAEYLKKRRKWDKRDGISSGTPSDKELAEEEENKQMDYLSMVESMVRKQEETGAKFVDGWQPHRFSSDGQQKKDFKGRYYFEKLGLTPIDVDEHLALRKSYIEGLMWCLAYYYKGCISWGWYFPYHYGPMLSDLTNLPDVMKSIKFELGAPLKPFEQLMGCLPPASSALVPPAYRKLMCSPTSPIIEFYPTDFKVDMNGKRNPWEGVNLLPFIDVELLKETIATHCPDRVLTGDERARNTLGSVFLYTFDLTASETVPSFNRDIGFPDISCCNSTVHILEESGNGDVVFKPQLVPGTKIPHPGFPSLNVLPIETVELNSIGLNCFGMPSKYPNTALFLHQMPQLPGAAEIAENVLGKTLFINWPMMHEAKVVAVSDSTCEVRIVKKKAKVKTFSEKESEAWSAESSLIQQQYFTGSGIPGSGGVNIGNIQIRLRLKPLQGMKTSPIDGSTKKVFGKDEADVPLQMALWNSPAPDTRFIERGPQTLKDLFPNECNVILTKGKYKGCRGVVLGTIDDGKEKKVITQVKVAPPEPPFGLAIARSVQESYISSSDAAKVLKMHPVVFARITGSVSVDPGRYDVGLNLKYKEDLCVLGYSRKKELIQHSSKKKTLQKKENVWAVGDSLRVIGSDRFSSSENNQNDSEANGNGKVLWEYTPKAIRLVAAYRQKFPQLFAALTKNPTERFYDAKFLLGSNGEEMLPKVREWLDSLETAKIPRMPTSTVAMPLTAIAAVQRAAEVRLAALEQSGPLQEVKIRVPPSALYREGSTTATDVVALDTVSTPQLGDRIANLCANGIPFGARGTVVSIHHSLHGCVEVVMDEEFIGGSNLQGSCANFRGKLCVWAHLLKISACDSTGMVDNHIPSGSSKEKVKQLGSTDDIKGSASDATCGGLSKNIEPLHKPTPQTEESTSSSGAVKKSTPKGSVDSNKHARSKAPIESNRSRTPTEARRSRTPIENRRARTPTEIRGAQSPGRRKQGAWKEAVGPHGDNIGFKGGNRGVNSGFKAWKQMTSCDRQSKGTAIDETSRGNAVTSTSSNDASAGLKAMLGVESDAAQATQRTSRSLSSPGDATNDASSGLKAVLGLGASQNGAPSQNPTRAEPSSPAPKTAADALMQLMINDESSNATPFPEQMHSHEPNFNFTYVQEGQERPDNSLMQAQQQSMSMPIQQQYPSMPSTAPGATYPYPMMQHSHPNMMHHPMPTVVGAPPPGSFPAGYTAVGSSAPSTSYVPAGGVVPREKKSKARNSRSKGASSTTDKIVPSVVVNKR